MLLLKGPEGARDPSVDQKKDHGDRRGAHLSDGRYSYAVNGNGDAGQR